MFEISFAVSVFNQMIGIYTFCRWIGAQERGKLVGAWVELVCTRALLYIKFNLMRPFTLITHVSNQA
jgi:hypothetical protein